MAYCSPDGAMWPVPVAPHEAAPVVYTAVDPDEAE